VKLRRSRKKKRRQWASTNHFAIRQPTISDGCPTPLQETTAEHGKVDPAGQ
jgi:hypothetical protein